MSIAPKETERVTPDHLAPLESSLAGAEGWVSVKPSGKPGFAAAVGARAKPTQGNRLVTADMSITPIQFKALLFTEDPNGDRGLVR